WRGTLQRIEQARKDGFPLRGQVCGRPVGIMMGLGLGRNPFMHAPAYQEIAHLPTAERAAAMREPARRERIITEAMGGSSREGGFYSHFDIMYEFDDSGYEPGTNQTLAARAAAAGVDPAGYAYDVMTKGDGDSVFYFPVVNFVGNTMGAAEEMIT